MLRKLGYCDVKSEVERLREVVYVCECVFFVKKIRRAFCNVVVCTTDGRCGGLFLRFGLGKLLREEARELIGSPIEISIEEMQQGASKAQVKLCRGSYRQLKVAMNI